MTITYPVKGRGAWPDSGTGGTLNAQGSNKGKFYRTPSKEYSVVFPGLICFRALRDKKPISVNNFAVYIAVKAIQRVTGTNDDGLFGPTTEKAVIAWQMKKKIVADGVFGPRSAKAAFKPMVTDYADRVHPTDLHRLGLLSSAHIEYESRWDPGAVGVTTPHDLGIGQINGLSHPNLNEHYRLDPATAIPFVVQFVAENMMAFPGNEDAQIAAYNLGRSGASSWVKDGMPDVYGKTEVREYINNILAHL